MKVWLVVTSRCKRLCTHYTILYLMLLFCNQIYAQDLSTIGNGENPFEISGGISVNQILYASNNTRAARKPYTYFASGNLNLSLYGFSAPFSFTFSNNTFGFQQPFNQFSLNPTYKWISAQIGTSSMSFSPYTLSGHPFFGVGLDLSPTESIKVQLMYGQLREAIEPEVDSTNNLINTPSFSRTGYGFKVDYSGETEFVSVIFFKASDDLQSISSTVLEGDSTSTLVPQDNVAMSLSLGGTIADVWSLSAEVATSALSRDSRSIESAAGAGVFSFTPFLFTSRVSSSYYNAYKVSTAYKGEIFSIGGNFEHVDPDYATLGGFFFNNDFQNYTADLSLALLGGGLSISLNGGLQRNNLTGEQLSTSRRLIGSANVNVSLVENLNMTVSYSNFQTFMVIRSDFENINQLTPFDNLDTLNFTQISQNANLNIGYVLSQSKEMRQNVNLNMSLQTASNTQTPTSDSEFYNTSALYAISLPKSGISISSNVNASYNVSNEIESLTLGPTLSANFSFLKKTLRASSSLSYNTAYVNEKKVSSVLNIRLSTAYTLFKKHAFSANLVALQRSFVRNEVENTNRELTFTFGYNFNF